MSKDMRQRIVILIAIFAFLSYFLFSIYKISLLERNENLLFMRLFSAFFWSGMVGFVVYLLFMISVWFGKEKMKLEKFIDKYGVKIERCTRREYFIKACENCKERKCPNQILKDIEKRLQNNPYEDISITELYQKKDE